MSEEEVRYLRVPGKQETVVMLLLLIVLCLIMFFFLTNEIVLGLVSVACFVFLLWALKKVQRHANICSMEIGGTRARA